ncbi:MAG: hypothetical protein N3H30_02085 [Candidatus Micrarchaeota archaeon]|nr:hypothetical protein [Candidatus Micrarchaeota archaeon]
MENSYMQAQAFERIRKAMKKGFALMLPLVAPLMLSAGEPILRERIPVGNGCAWRTIENNTLLKYSCTSQSIRFEVMVKPENADYITLFTYPTKNGRLPAALVVKSDGEVMACALSVQTETGIYNCTYTMLDDPTMRPIYAKQTKRSTVFLMEGKNGNMINFEALHKDLTLHHK